MDVRDGKFFGLWAIVFALFIIMADIASHWTGHVVRQREEAMLQHIDAQMLRSRTLLTVLLGANGSGKYPAMSRTITRTEWN